MTVTWAGTTVLEFRERRGDPSGKFAGTASLEIGRLEVPDQESGVYRSSRGYRTCAFDIDTA
jgi:hypothetical protein